MRDALPLHHTDLRPEIIGRISSAATIELPV